MSRASARSSTFSSGTPSSYVVTELAVRAEIEPLHLDGTRGEPAEVSPHALRHGVVYRIMNAEAGNTLYDVRNQLRHQSIQTTERIYNHIIEA